MTRGFTPYSSAYIENCFTLWYAAGRPKSTTQFVATLPEDEHGRRPSVGGVLKWMREGGWDMRADDLDARAITLVENDLVTQKAIMLREQAKIGFELQQMGMAYLKERQFDSSASAVSAVIRGAELERSSRGIGELIVKMAGMTDAELEAEIMKQLTRATDAGQIIEGEVKEEEETGDTE